MIGKTKKVSISYGPNGQSRGVATVVFKNPASAVQAAKQMNGVKIDERPMKVCIILTLGPYPQSDVCKVELVVGADQAPVPVPAKALSDRITYVIPHDLLE